MCGEGDLGIINLLLLRLPPFVISKGTMDTPSVSFSSSSICRSLDVDELVDISLFRSGNCFKI